MSRQVQVTFDARDPHALAAWWAELLGYRVEDGHDVIAGLLESGAVTEDDVVRIDGRLSFATAVAASDPDGTGPRLYFQRVPEAKAVKNRVHLDLASRSVAIPRPRSPDWWSWAPPGSPTRRSGATPGRSCRTLRATSSACRG